jgi:hypothetical protein
MISTLFATDSKGRFTAAEFKSGSIAKIGSHTTISKPYSKAYRVVRGPSHKGPRCELMALCKDSAYIMARALEFGLTDAQKARSANALSRALIAGVSFEKPVRS